MKIKKMTIILFLLVVITILPSQVISYGLAPSSYEFDYEKGQTKTLSLRVLNSYNEHLILDIKAEGTLADKITFEKTHLELTPEQRERKIVYTIKMDKDINPGPHEIKIKIIQQAPNVIESTSVVNTVTTLVQKVTILVPYPGTYMIGSLYAQGRALNEPITFTARLYNKGQEAIIPKGELIIYSINKTQVGKITLTGNSIPGSKDSKIQVKHPGISKPGVYKVKAKFEYEEKELLLEDTFTIGKKQVELLSLDFGPFNLGAIIKLTMMLENKWNQDIKSVSANVEVIQDGTKVVSSFETNEAYISAQGIGRIEGYWETSGLLAGPYSLFITLTHEGITSKQIFDMTLYEKSIKVIEQGLSGNIVIEGTKTKNKFIPLASLVFILIIINIIVLIKYKKKK